MVKLYKVPIVLLTTNNLFNEIRNFGNGNLHNSVTINQILIRFAQNHWFYNDV